jgi:hypothetical protein
MDLNLQRRPPHRMAEAPGRIVVPLPPGVVMCLYCGPLLVIGSLASTAGSHTGATAHPTVFATGAQ